LRVQAKVNFSKGAGEETAGEIQKLREVREKVVGDLIIVGDFNFHLQEENEKILKAIKKIDERHVYQPLIKAQATMTDIREGSNFLFFIVYS
jgi:hypothetical protein